MKESQNIEYKSSWRDEYLKWICGYANADGGALYVGRDDNGKVVGLDNAEKLLEDIPNKVRDILGIMIQVNLRERSGREYLEIVVEPYPYPVSYKGEYHYRSGSTKQELKGAALDKFLLRKQGRHWDGVPVPHVRLQDLDKAAIASFRKRALAGKRLAPEIIDEPNAGLVEKLHLLDGTYLKRAGVLLFHPDPEKFVTGAFVKIGYFRTNADLVFHDEVHGGLFHQVENAIDLLLTKYLRAGISYEGIQRMEAYPVPEAAIREAVLNAIIHKDYASSIPIQISVYDDKIMLWNPGHLPTNWTVEKLKSKHSSQPFNPDIANAFFRAGLIEAWGRGIERILETCKTAGIPEPTFQYEATGIWMQFAFGKSAVTSAISDVVLKASEIASEKTSEKTSEKILAILAVKSEATIAELASATGISTRSIERNIKNLLNDGRLRRVGSKRNGHWEIPTFDNSCQSTTNDDKQGRKSSTETGTGRNKKA